MKAGELKSMYRTVMDDHFPPRIEISFLDGGAKQTLVCEKADWETEGTGKGLRYGENPGQEAALDRLTGGNLALGEVTCIEPGRHLASNVELLQSGKHPGKINITDADNALNILRYFSETPCTAIMKHNNPCGVAKGTSLAESYAKANMADRLAAFGGTVALNREVDRDTALLIAQSYSEVVVAPEYAPGVLGVLKARKNLRIMKIENMGRLRDYVGRRFVDFKSLIDGGIVVQWSYAPKARSREDLMPAQTTYKGRAYNVDRMPTEREYDDLLFGWLVESGVSSNSVIFVKDGCTVGIGTGEQDRVGVAEIARDKAYRKLADRLCWEKLHTPYNELKDTEAREEIDREVAARKGGLIGCCMISDAYFPFRDGIDVGLRDGVSAVIQPGGSLRDFECIQACNEAGASMVFTGERSFKH